MVVPKPGEVTRLLQLAGEGSQDAIDRLLPVVYAEMRNLADMHMARERSGHTLQPTALVHEAYLKLVGQNSVGFRDRSEFFGVASKVMRRILVDHARRRKREKHGGDRQRTSLDYAIDQIEASTGDLLVLDDAIGELARRDERKAQLVELRFFGGLTLSDAARMLDISDRTAERDWTMARAWLMQSLGNAAPQDATDA